MNEELLEALENLESVAVVTRICGNKKGKVEINPSFALKLGELAREAIRQRQQIADIENGGVK